ncbi:hypothetical protein BASA81_003773 [Batrachochytrium salamandrivorans]|nr:hypothetical protein BASA81_003773 [Batrachochytrium salamandrivorans]
MDDLDKELAGDVELDSAAAVAANGGEHEDVFEEEEEHASAEAAAAALDEDEDIFEEEEAPNRVVLFEGPFFLLQDTDLQETFAKPVVDMLVAGGLDPDACLGEWSLRLTTKRYSQVDCQYITDNRDVLKSMASIAKHFKVPNTARKSTVKADFSSSHQPPRRLSSRVVPTTSAPREDQGKKKARQHDSDNDDGDNGDSGAKKPSHKKKYKQPLPQGNRAPSSRRNVRTNFLDLDDEYGSDGAGPSNHQAPSALPLESVWGADKLGLLPSKNRQLLLNEQLKQMHLLLDELFVIDTAQLFVSNTIKVPGGGPCNLHEIRHKVFAMEYSAGGREAMVFWDKLAEDVENIYKLFAPEVIVNSKTHVPQFLDVLRSTCLESDNELQSQLVKLRTTEERSFLREKNNEPAMPKWRKELMPTYTYVQLEDYVPAEALLPEEKVQLLAKLDDTSGKPNRWVYPDGLEMVDLWAKVMALDRSPNSVAMGPKMEDAIAVDKINEQHTWGIDCFCRRNVQVSLAKLLTVPQAHYFTEQILLRAINAVRPLDQGWNMRLALHQIIQENLGEAEPNLPQPLTLKYRRIKVFSSEQDLWRYGRIIECNNEEGNNVLIAFDEEKEDAEWLNLTEEMHQLLGEANAVEVYDSNLTPQLIRTCCEGLLDSIEKKGERMFAVHSKGVGVVTKVPIDTGKLIQKYTGLLYPCWLWEQKEAQEDAERLEKKRLTNQIVLPDFWNMRLELPGGDSEGVDLLHVDAKNGGNFSSRMSHSCRPNCGTMTCVVDGRYCIGMRALRPIQIGEELTIDYNCVTDSNDEYLAAVCLCGAHDCRGSFLFTTNATKHIQVSNRSHVPLHRVAMLFAACGEQPGELEKRYGKAATDTWPIWISEEERAERRKKKKTGGKQQPYYRRGGGRRMGVSEGNEEVEDAHMVSWPLISAMEEEDESVVNPIVSQVLAKRGLGKRALQMLPNWLLRYAAYLVEFVDCEHFEFARLEFHKSENKATTTQDVDERWRIAQLESDATAEQRITNLVIALDKARHYMRERLTPQCAGSDRSKLRDIWWISDRCLSKWVGDDEDEFPEWYGATVTHVYVEKQEVRLQYDTHEVNRVPMKLVKRPKVNEIPSPHTGCNVPHHQAPFRVLDEDDVLFFLWTDGDSGIATRLVKCLCEIMTSPVQLWQTATTMSGTRGSYTKQMYWWNFDTREMRLTKPSQRQMELKTEFVPKVLKQIQRLLLEKTPTSGDGARKCLRELRDLILRIPIPPSSYAIHDNMHQKAADLLTLLSNTKNFFVLREPEVIQGKSVIIPPQQHAVINALTSWIGQGVESRVEDITEMIGSALLPSVERAYEHCAGDYRNQIRPALIDHLRSNGLARWPKEVREAFPHSNQLPPQPSDIETQWPHPLPPIRLFGSPSLDAAIYENFDYTRTVALAREMINNRDLVRFTEKDNKATQHLFSVSEALNKASQRDLSKMDYEDRERVTAPGLPDEIQFTWVQCELPTCGKWRKLPLGFDERRLPSPFTCLCLGPDIDEEHASCEATQEEDYLPSAASKLAELNLSLVERGDYIDVYNGREWVIGLVLEVGRKPNHEDEKRQEEQVKVRMLHPALPPQVEWKSKHPEGTAFSSLAQLHTYTLETDMIRAMDECEPYDTLFPETNLEVSHCLHALVRKLETSEMQDRKKKRKAKRMRNKTQMTMARQVETLAKVQLSAQMDNAQKNAFYAFWLHEKNQSPLQPFMSTVAKWNLLDQSQRMTWSTAQSHHSGGVGGKRPGPVLATGTVVPPPKNEMAFNGPGLLTTPKQSIAMQSLGNGNAETNEFLAQVSGRGLAVGMLVDTPYGRGVITQTSIESICVTLVWGKAYFAPSTVRCSFPMFAACQELQALPAERKKRPSGSAATGSRRKQVKFDEEDKPPKPLSAKKKKLLEPFAQMIEDRAVRWRKRWAHMFT